MKRVANKIMKHPAAKVFLSLIFTLSNTTLILANEGGKLAEGFTDLFVELLAKFFLFILGFWLIGKLLYWLIDKVQHKNKPQ